MEYLKESDLYEIPPSQQSATNSQNKERIDGGYDVYENVLKLVDIRLITVSIPTFNLVEGTGVGTAVANSIFHELGRTPFVEIEWDAANFSFIGSGGNTVGSLSITCQFNDLQIDIGGSFQYQNFIDPSEVSYPGFDVRLRILIYDLNTKRRLDTYIK